MHVVLIVQKNVKKCHQVIVLHRNNVIMRISGPCSFLKMTILIYVCAVVFCFPEVGCVSYKINKMFSAVPFDVLYTYVYCGDAVRLEICHPMQAEPRR